MKSEIRRGELGKVYVTRRIPDAGLNLILERTDARVNPHDRVLTRRELLREIRGVDGLVPLLTDPIDGAVMDAAGPQLKVIANYAGGFNNIDVAAATARKIPVTNTPGVLTETTADLAWTLLMAVARRIVESDRFTRAGKFKGWGPMMFLGHDVYGKTLGIVGFGRIGQAAARRAAGFGMKILAFDPRPDGSAADQLGAHLVDLPTLLRESDFITLHTLLTPETTHLIGETQLRSMKPTAIIVNTSRGPVIDENALVKALKSGWIGGAGLDVYEHEPKLAAGLNKQWNAVVVPHIASATIETRGKMAEIAAANLISALEGKRPPNIVNPEIYNG